MAAPAVEQRQASSLDSAAPLRQHDGDDMDKAREHEVRAAAFAYLDGLVERFPDAIPARPLQQGFDWHGERVSLLGSGPGIWKPRMLDAALSMMTTAPRAGQPPPYIDELSGDGRLRYAYKGTDPGFWQNRALRAAWEHQLPLVYLYGVAPGMYLAQYPAVIETDRPKDLRVDVVFTDRLESAGMAVELDDRAYTTKTRLSRLHQRAFRIRVLLAYEGRCAMCALKRSPLLDAAHIVPDGEPLGLAVTANGLSLCKLHHAAYDQSLVGVRPDLQVEVARDVLDEMDGPMLLHGLQALDGQHLRALPRRRVDLPDRERLQWRYDRFRSHGQV
jgi:putative restriction endonuclease